MLHQNKSEVGNYASDSVGSISKNMLTKIEPRLKEVVDTTTITTTGTTAQTDQNIGDETTNDYDDTDIESYDYYYGLDYGDEEVGLADLIADLGPDLLQTVSPTLIVGFFESASPEDVESILNNSDFLLKLPAETIGLVMQKLPTELIIKIVNSKGVRDFYLIPPEDPREAKRQKTFQADISLVLFEKLDASVITSLPQFLIKSQLENRNLIVELLKFPEKLLSLVKIFPNLLLEIPTEVLLSIGENNSTELTKIPIERIFETLGEIPIEVLSSLFEKLTDITPRIFIKYLKVIPLQVLSNLNRLFSRIPSKALLSALQDIRSETISEVIREIPQDVITTLIRSMPSDYLLQLSSNRVLINKLQPKDIENLVDKVPTDQLKLLIAHGLLADKKLLEIVPLTAITKVARNVELLSLISDKTLLLVADLFPNLLESLPSSTVAHIVKTRPWIVGMLPMSVFTSLSSSRLEDLLALLSDQDIVNLVTFQPALINVAAKLPSNLLIKVMLSRKSLLSKLPSMAQPFISQLLVNEDFIKKFPVSFLASLVGIKGIEKFVTKFAVITILRVHPSLPTLISPSEFKPFIHFLSDPWFRTTIPCRTISMISKDKEATDLVDIIPSSIMEKVITSRRILSCIPTAHLKNLMDQRLGLSRLSMSSLIKGARQLPSEKYSMGLLFKFLKQQAPELGKALLKWELRWETK